MNEFSTASLISPDVLYGELFRNIQLNKVFPDYKTFVDCIPLFSATEIIERYNVRKTLEDFDLKKFVEEHFKYPDTHDFAYKTDITLTIVQHIESLWYILTRQSQLLVTHSSLISLPHSYIIPGGRFIEIFYWDSYFIMLGLHQSGKMDLLQNMIDNFSYLIETLGFIPNGNRSYFLTRSQPPMYAMMIELIVEKDPPLLLSYLPFLEKEYQFWMNGSEILNEQQQAHKRVVRMPDGTLLNRYWDDQDTPRPEAYGKDMSYAHNMDAEQSAVLYRHIRAACESGWDFSTRWYRDENTIQTIHTTEIIPIDLNCLLQFLEIQISKAYHMKGMQPEADKYNGFAAARRQAMNKYCWNEEQQFFMDYNYVEQKTTPSFSLAGAFPLYFRLADERQAEAVANKLRTDFLKDGGFLTTLKHSDFQWDSPNGWAPLQWITNIGLMNYNHTELAQTAASRWMLLNEKVYTHTGKLMEKYNVVDMNSLTGGGEYPLQDGFGWTNGVYLSLKKIFPEHV
jgi:alpha,alpha-trehalase